MGDIDGKPIGPDETTKGSRRLYGSGIGLRLYVAGSLPRVNPTGPPLPEPFCVNREARGKGLYASGIPA